MLETPRPPGPSEEDCLAFLEMMVGKMPVTPRGYQARAFHRILEEFDGGTRSTLLVLPTGTGKTVTFLMVAKWVIEQTGGRVLVLAHRGELIAQAASAASAVGLVSAIEMADDHARPDLTLGKHASETRSFWDKGEPGEELDLCRDDGDPKLIVASVQTMQGKRLKAWPEGHFDLVITDEAHHAPADSYRAILAHLKPPMYLGVTATWDRGDETPVCGAGQVFESLAFEYTLIEAVEQGFLARPTFECLPCGVDLSAIRTTGGDLNAGDLEAAIRPHVETLVNEAMPSLEGRTFLVFTPDVGCADAVASAFRSRGVSCESVSGKDKDRDETIGQFKGGRYRGLANCALLTEGFDYPPIDAIVMMRPTKSRALFTQMCGRGTRLSPGKAECLVIGYDWKTLRHKLIHPVQLFHSDRIDAESLAGAKELVDSGKETDLLLALKRANAEKAERKRLAIEIEDRKRRSRAVRYDPLSFDPDFAPPRQGHDSAAWEAKATDRQIAALERIGYKPAEVVDWTKLQASSVLGRLAERRDRGLATFKQVKLLLKLGCKEASKLTLAEATAEIDRRIHGDRAAG